MPCGADAAKALQADPNRLCTGFAIAFSPRKPHRPADADDFDCPVQDSQLRVDGHVLEHGTGLRNGCPDCRNLHFVAGAWIASSARSQMMQVKRPKATDFDMRSTSHGLATNLALGTTCSIFSRKISRRVRFFFLSYSACEKLTWLGGVGFISWRC